MADSDPYSRHYWRLVDDAKFAEIYGDDHHYALWSRLLMLADQAWPATAHVPITARKASVAKLAEVGLIDILPGGRFRMRGTDKERRKRSEHARNAAIVRWQELSNARSNANGNAGSSAQTMPSREEQSKAQQSNASSKPSLAAIRLAKKGAMDRLRWTGVWAPIDEERFGPRPPWNPEWGPELT